MNRGLKMSIPAWITLAPYIVARKRGDKTTTAACRYAWLACLAFLAADTYTTAKKG